MELNEFVQLLNTLSIPVACNHFTSPQVAPFMVYKDNGSENFGADNVTYFETIDIDLELYTLTIDDALETKIKKLLTDNKIYYEWSRAWIASEKIYQTTFEVSI